MSTAKTDMIIVKLISGSKAEAQAEAEALDFVISLLIPLLLSRRKKSFGTFTYISQVRINQSSKNR